MTGKDKTGKKETILKTLVKYNMPVNLLKSIFPVLMLFALFAEDLSGATYYTRDGGSGNWNDGDTWSLVGPWNAPAGSVPGPGDDVIIGDPWWYTMNLNVASATINSLTVQNGAVLNLNGNTLTVTGNVASSNQGYINCGDGNLIAGGNLSTSNASSSIRWRNGNIIVNGSVNCGISGGWGTMGLICTGSGVFIMNGTLFTIDVAMTIPNFKVGSGALVMSGSTLTVSGIFDRSCYPMPGGRPVNVTGTTINATPCTPSLSATVLPGFGDVCPGTTAGPHSFTINGLGLTAANVTVAALPGYTYSTTPGGTYTGTLSLTQGGGGVYSRTIYVKFTPLSEASYNGNIVIGGGGAPGINVAAAGSGAGSVVPVITSPVASNILFTSATLGGTITIEGCFSQTVTERGIYYSTTAGFADGAGTKVSETGTFGTGAFTIDVTGLSPSATYYFKAFATNSSGTAYSSQATFTNIPRNLYYVTGGGNWGTTANWKVGSCGGPSATSLPTPIDNVFIQCAWGNTVTINIADAYCHNLTLNEGTTLNLNGNTLTLSGSATVATSNQGTLTVGNGTLKVKGNLTVYRNNGGNLNWEAGTITVSGNFTDHGGWGNYGGARTGFFIMDGATATLTASADITIPNFRQPSVGFTKAGGGILTISNVFDRNCGLPAPAGVTISIPGNTINSSCATAAITTGTISGSPFCAGSAVTVPFTVTGTYSPGNVFTAQLSDATGNFNSPVNIGSVARTTAGNISATIPAGTTAGNGYRIRVVSSNPAVTGQDNGSNIMVNPPPAISLAVNSGHESICDGSTAEIVINFSATTLYTISIYNNGEPFDELTGSSPSPRSYPLTMQWTGPAANNAYQFTASVTDSNGCSGITGDAAEVTVWKIPETGPYYHIANTF